MKLDFRVARLSGRERAILELSERLTSAPWRIAGDDVEALRREGLAGPEALLVILECAHFNYLNRVADGLGIRLEYAQTLPDMRPWQRGPAAAPGAAGGPAAGEVGPDDVFRGLEALPAVKTTAEAWRRYHLRPTAALGARERLAVLALGAAWGGSSSAARLHGRALEGAGGADLALASGEIPAGAGPRERAILEHARRLAAEPWTAREEHVDGLRALGLDDRAVLQLTTLAAYTSFESRVAQGLAALRACP
ncbi:MAG: hypothetical protein HY721_03400 [Planctomycetes bacterium]|nr:hypothetical protein [Planctomycetota bacterium]